MGSLVEFDLEDGGSVLVEVADVRGLDAAVKDGTAGRAPATRSLQRAAPLAKAQRTFEEAVEGVLPAVLKMMAQMRSLAESPDEVRIEFGLDLHAQAGAFVASASTGANFSISLTWCRGEVRR